MSSSWVPPRPTYHLRIFVICLLLVVVSLIAFLFGVRLEAVVPATGVLRSRQQQEVRSLVAGLVELGWYEAEVTATSGSKIWARLDGHGNGLVEPTHAPAERIRDQRLPDGREIASALLHFHQLQEGDILWPGQPLGHIHAEAWQGQLLRLQARLQDLQSHGGSTRETLAQINHLREQLAKTAVKAPDDKNHWQVLKIQAGLMAAVKPGSPLVVVAPIDPQTLHPRDLVFELEIQEKYVSDVQPGQPLRLVSNMYNQRLYGHAEAVLEKIGPLGEMGGNGERLFRAQAAVVGAPFPLKLGSGFKAEIVVGHKPVYNIILEH